MVLCMLIMNLEYKINLNHLKILKNINKVQKCNKNRKNLNSHRVKNALFVLNKKENSLGNVFMLVYVKNVAKK